MSPVDSETCQGYPFQDQKEVLCCLALPWPPLTPCPVCPLCAWSAVRRFWPLSSTSIFSFSGTALRVVARAWFFFIFSSPWEAASWLHSSFGRGGEVRAPSHLLVWTCTNQTRPNQTNSSPRAAVTMRLATSSCNPACQEPRTITGVFAALCHANQCVLSQPVAYANSRSVAPNRPTFAQRWQWGQFPRCSERASF